MRDQQIAWDNAESDLTYQFVGVWSQKRGHNRCLAATDARSGPDADFRNDVDLIQDLLN